MDLLQYVNIKQGTKSQNRFSQGNTLPLLQRPFGFAAFSPQTNSERGAWFYHPEDRSFEGFRLTHQPSPWIGDYGALTVTAQTEIPWGTFDQSWSGIDPNQAVLTPYYGKYLLKRPRALLELTPTEYGAWFRVEFMRPQQNFISILAADSDYSMWFETGKLRLHCQAEIHQGHEKMRIFVIFEFPEGALDLSQSFGEAPDGRHLSPCENCLHKAYHLAVNQKKFTFRMAMSYISDRQAERNLQQEGNYENFQSLVEENKRIWEKTLHAVEIQAEEKVMKTFYSCLYRSFLFPHKAYETDEKGRAVHYAPALDTVRPGVRYTDNGFWDTYRTVYPFLSIIAPQKYREILEGYVNEYEDSGWLPRWTAGTARCCMPGTAIDAVIADGAVKGIFKGEALEKAFGGMVKHASVTSPQPEYGRAGIEDFISMGYMPYDRYHESVNLTLDASYFDGCIAAVAGILGKTDLQKTYEARSLNYRNLFDPDSGFMRGRDSRGAFQPDFDPCRWGNDYTEASAWQTTFAVQHDLDGLAELMGGREGLLGKLDRLFAEEPDYLVGSYCREIHEMTEMAACSLGQFAVSNQPSFHLPYIYAWFEETEKAACWVRRACQQGFSAEDDGFPGDEDNGSMALWYVFAVLGLYPICPGKPLYTHIPPMAKSIKILGKELHLSDLGNIITHAQLMERISGKSLVDDGSFLV